MNNCKSGSKKNCMNCKHYDYCDIANRCDGNCSACDINDCENNKNYKENDNEQH